MCQQIDDITGRPTGKTTGEPLGERIVVAGRVLDDDGRSVPHTLVEIWQTNAAGRYLHKNDQHPAPQCRRFPPSPSTSTSRWMRACRKSPFR